MVAQVTFHAGPPGMAARAVQNPLRL